MKEIGNKITSTELNSANRRQSKKKKKRGEGDENDAELSDSDSFSSVLDDELESIDGMDDSDQGKIGEYDKDESRLTTRQRTLLTENADSEFQFISLPMDSGKSSL